MDLYVYYRVRHENVAALRARAETMQRCLSEEYGIVPGLKRRPEEKDGMQTWMEIYEAVPSDFEAALERAVAREGVDALIDGRRNTEYFVDVSSCA
ncbi:DUF4936 family protein [Herbaspirillum sp. HC18]|nr:DUF4936 family protein [Herbaspirillum sp. HC18]